MSKKDLGKVPGFPEAVRDIKLCAGGRADHSVTREEGRTIMQSSGIPPSLMRWAYLEAGKQMGVRVLLPFRSKRGGGNGSVPSLKRMADSSEIKEMLLLQHQYEKLLREREEVSLEIDNLQVTLKELDGKLSVYKPVQAALESMRTAKQRVSEELVRMAQPGGGK